METNRLNALAGWPPGLSCLPAPIKPRSCTNGGVCALRRVTPTWQLSHHSSPTFLKYRTNVKISHRVYVKRNEWILSQRGCNLQLHWKCVLTLIYGNRVRTRLHCVNLLGWKNLTIPRMKLKKNIQETWRRGGNRTVNLQLQQLLQTQSGRWKPAPQRGHQCTCSLHCDCRPRLEEANKLTAL